MLTPVDINKKEFRRAMRGYNENEVDSFLDQVARDYETLLRDKLEVEEKLKHLEDQLLQYRKLEDTLNNTLVMAQKTAEEVKQNATREAQLLLREAQAEAEEIIHQATLKKETLENEQAELIQSLVGFKSQIRAFLKAQLDMIEKLPLGDKASEHEDN
ncbi:MAG: DivIVA domain-containing protein [Syntrophomonadaceae bacterium]|nr:DivIVA domain-containing protein [Syntrophomonadaceae bacterium]